MNDKHQPMHFTFMWSALVGVYHSVNWKNARWNVKIYKFDFFFHLPFDQVAGTRLNFSLSVLFLPMSPFLL